MIETYKESPTYLSAILWPYFNKDEKMFWAIADSGNTSNKWINERIMNAFPDVDVLFL